MSFARALSIVSGLTIISRMSGFIRDTLTAMMLGAGPVADAAFVAQRLPNLFRSLFAEGAFSAAFVPLYTTEQQKHGFKAAQHFAGQALALLLAILVPFSIVIMAFMPLMIRVLAPGYYENDPSKFALTVKFSLITFPYLALISITALQGGVLNAQGRFAAAAAAPISLNVVVVCALIGAHYKHWQVGYTLCWAFLLSGVVQLTLLAISCWRAGSSIPLARPKMNKTNQDFFKRIGPGALGAGAGQVNLLMSTILASTLPTGAVSCLNYADRLEQLPLGIVGIAVSTTLLPLLARCVEAGAEDKVRHYTSRALEFCIMLGLPAALGLIFAAKPIVQTLFQHGAFAEEDTIKTAQALSGYAIGIPAFLLVKVFAADFFARHDTKTPVKMAFVAMVTNVVCALAMLGSLQHIGIALASSIALWTNAGLLFMRLKKRRKNLTDEKWHYRLPRLLLCSLIMSVAAYALVHYTQHWFTGKHTGAEIAGLTLILGAAGLCYALSLQITGAMRLGDMLTILRRGAKGSSEPPDLTGQP